MSPAIGKTLRDTAYGIDGLVEWKPEYHKSCDETQDGDLPSHRCRPATLANHEPGPTCYALNRPDDKGLRLTLILV